MSSERSGLAEVIDEHEPWSAQDGVFCSGCDWERLYDGRETTGESWGQHLTDALLAHLADVLGSDETRARVEVGVHAGQCGFSDACTFAELSEYPTPCSEVLIPEVADGALAAVREVLGLPSDPHNRPLSDEQGEVAPESVSTGERVVEEVPGEWDGRGCDE